MLNDHTDLLARLESLAAPVQPAERLPVIEGLRSRTRTVQESLAALRTEHADLLDRLCSLDVRRLEPCLVPTAFPMIAKAVSNAGRVRDILDSPQRDLAEAARAIGGAVLEYEFNTAARKLKESVELAEGTRAVVAKALAVTLDVLAHADASIFSDCHVVPAGPQQTPGRGAPTVAAR